MTIVRNRDTAFISWKKYFLLSSVMVSYEFWEVCVTCSGHISLRRTDKSVLIINGDRFVVSDKYLRP